jgi:Zn-dependent protease with chaperone function
MSTLDSDLFLKPASGHYYDGRSSRVYNVTFSIQGGNCRISGDGIDKTVPVSDITLSEQLDKANRILRFSDGSSCELSDSRHLSAIFEGSSLKDTFVNRLQRSWRWVIISLLLLTVVFFAGYKWGVPFAAEKLAYRLPYAALRMISQQALSTIDGRFMQPSKLSPQRQDQLRERFAGIAFPQAQKIPVKVEFRESEMLGANAFALPDGTIVFLDKLVQLAGNDDELVAVYAHEAGHVANRHSMRQLIQSSIVALALAAYLGDVSSLAGAMSGFLLQAKYSRDFERDADRYAAAVLRNNNLSPRLLGTFLKKLEEAHNKRTGSQRDDKLLDYISSHPSTDERMKEIESLSKH